MSTTPADAGLRERKKLQTRLRIHDVAVRLAASKGLDAVTVDEIAAAAEVSTRTFFNYFAGKDQAIVGVDPDARAAYAEAIRQAPAGLGPLDCLEHVALTVMLPSLHGPGLKALRMQVVHDNPRLLPALFEAWRQMGEIGTQALAQRLGLPDDDPFPELAVSVATAVMRTAMGVAARQDRDPAECLREAFACVRGGLQAPAR